MASDCEETSILMASKRARYMLVIIDFDPRKKQFIINNPGTKNNI
ncbi:MAG TPA: hypothetical protein PLA53_01815 [bacterium]|jgi:hypothetical protein|nr:hypothetical protein [bacterium]HNZ51586.1 hypothetical protein [bacterium]HOF79460.1 hypothetical protein [bacterium]HOH85269.1 hypothetical protein [bacterium]HOQ91836.1 hypothetical protein [bacterium]